MESYINMLIVMSVVVFVTTALGSLWKRGAWGFILLLASSATSFAVVLTSYYMEHGYLGVKPIAITGWLYLLIVYFFGVKFVMKTSFFGLEPREKYKKYLKDNNISGAFPIFISYLGPVLFSSVFGLITIDIVTRIT